MKEKELIKKNVNINILFKQRIFMFCHELFNFKILNNPLDIKL